MKTFEQIQPHTSDAHAERLSDSHEWFDGNDSTNLKSAEVQPSSPAYEFTELSPEPRLSDSHEWFDGNDSTNLKSAEVQPSSPAYEFTELSPEPRRKRLSDEHWWGDGKDSSTQNLAAENTSPVSTAEVYNKQTSKIRRIGALLLATAIVRPVSVQVRGVYDRVTGRTNTAK